MNTINELLERYARDHSNEDVDEIIAYIRKTLASYDAGIKPKKESGSFNMSDVIKNISATRTPTAPPPAPVKSKRRI